MSSPRRRCQTFLPRGRTEEGEQTMLPIGCLYEFRPTQQRWMGNRDLCIWISLTLGQPFVSGKALQQIRIIRCRCRCHLPNHLDMCITNSRFGLLPIRQTATVSHVGNIHVLFQILIDD